MKRVLAIIAATVGFISIARSDEVNGFDDETIKRSVQCEFGRAARDVWRIAPISRSIALKGTIKAEREDFTAKEVKGEGGWFSWWSKTTFTDERGDKTLGIFRTRYNIHPANAVVCDIFKKQIVKLNVDNCLRERAQSLNEDGGQLGCEHRVTGILKQEVGVGKDIWIVNASVSGSYAKKSTYSVQVTVPPEPLGSKPTPPTPSTTVNSSFIEEGPFDGVLAILSPEPRANPD